MLFRGPRSTSIRGKADDAYDCLLWRDGPLEEEDGRGDAGGSIDAHGTGFAVTLASLASFASAWRDSTATSSSLTIADAPNSTEEGSSVSG